MTDRPIVTRTHAPRPGSRPPAAVHHPPACCPSCGFNLVAAAPRSFGRLSIDPVGVTSFDGLPVALGPAPRDVLAGLAHAAPRTLSNGALLLRLGTEADGNVVAVHVSRIRAAFARIGAPDPIATHARRGYRLAIERFPGLPADFPTPPHDPADDATATAGTASC